MKLLSRIVHSKTQTNTFVIIILSITTLQYLSPLYDPFILKLDGSLLQATSIAISILSLRTKLVYAVFNIPSLIWVASIIFAILGLLLSTLIIMFCLFNNPFVKRNFLVVTIGLSMKIYVTAFLFPITENITILLTELSDSYFSIIVVVFSILFLSIVYITNIFVVDIMLEAKPIFPTLNFLNQMIWPAFVPFTLNSNIISQIILVGICLLRASQILSLRLLQFVASPRTSMTFLLLQIVPSSLFVFSDQLGTYYAAIQGASISFCFITPQLVFQNRNKLLLSKISYFVSKDQLVRYFINLYYKILNIDKDQLTQKLLRGHLEEHKATCSDPMCYYPEIHEDKANAASEFMLWLKSMMNIYFNRMSEDLVAHLLLVQVEGSFYKSLFVIINACENFRKQPFAIFGIYPFLYQRKVKLKQMLTSSSETHNPNFKEFFKDGKFERKFESKIQRAVCGVNEFWLAIANEKMRNSLEPLEKLRAEIEEMDALMEDYLSKSHISSRIHIFFAYAAFTKIFLKDLKKSNEIIKKCVPRIQNEGGLNNVNVSVFGSNKFYLTLKYSQTNGLTIEDASPEIEHILYFTKRHLKGFSLSAIIPSFLVGNHENLVSNFFENGQSFPKHAKLLMRDVDSKLHNGTIRAKIKFDRSQNLQVLCLIEKIPFVLDKTPCEYLIFHAITQQILGSSPNISSIINIENVLNRIELNGDFFALRQTLPFMRIDRSMLNHEFSQKQVLSYNYVHPKLLPQIQDANGEFVFSYTLEPFVSEEIAAIYIHNKINYRVDDRKHKSSILANHPESITKIKNSLKLKAPQTVAVKPTQKKKFSILRQIVPILVILILIEVGVMALLLSLFIKANLRLHDIFSYKMNVLQHNFTFQQLFLFTTLNLMQYNCTNTLDASSIKELNKTSDHITILIRKLEALTPLVETQEQNLGLEVPYVLAPCAYQTDPNVNQTSVSTLKSCQVQLLTLAKQIQEQQVFRESSIYIIGKNAFFTNYLAMTKFYFYMKPVIIEECNNIVVLATKIILISQIPSIFVIVFLIFVNYCFQKQMRTEISYLIKMQKHKAVMLSNIVVKFFRFLSSYKMMLYDLGLTREPPQEQQELQMTTLKSSAQDYHAMMMKAMVECQLKKTLMSQHLVKLSEDQIQNNSARNMKIVSAPFVPDSSQFLLDRKMTVGIIAKRLIKIILCILLVLSLPLFIGFVYSLIDMRRQINGSQISLIMFQIQYNRNFGMRLLLSKTYSNLTTPDHTPSYISLPLDSIDANFLESASPVIDMDYVNASGFLKEIYKEAMGTTELLSTKSINTTITSPVSFLFPATMANYSNFWLTNFCKDPYSFQNCEGLDQIARIDYDFINYCINDIIQHYRFECVRSKTDFSAQFKSTFHETLRLTIEISYYFMSMCENTSRIVRDNLIFFSIIFVFVIIGTHLLLYFAYVRVFAHRWGKLNEIFLFARTISRIEEPEA